MGMIGRYLDRLPDAARDRVIEGQGWIHRHYMDLAGNRCLEGHASDFRLVEGVGMRAGARDVIGFCAGDFDWLVDRVGLPRAVRLVKARAGKGAPYYPEKHAVLVLFAPQGVTAERVGA